MVKKLQKWQHKKAEKRFLRALKIARTLDINVSTHEVNLKHIKPMLAHPHHVRGALKVLTKLPVF
jgi:hypothetical protein